MKLRHFKYSVLKVNQTFSTNELLWQLLESKPYDCGFSVIAEAQSKGKGQTGNEWITEPGKNLTTSIYIQPELEAKNAFYLNKITALAVHKTLADFKVSSQIKWPNDILVNNAKIAGLLVENQIQGQIIRKTVIGVGLNINQKIFPLDRPITSIYSELGKTLSIESVFNRLHFHLDYYFDLLLQKKFSVLKNQYLENLFQLHKIAAYKSPSTGEFMGTITGIDAHGRLKITSIDGNEGIYDIQTIQFL